MTDSDNLDEFENVTEIKKALRQDGDINITKLDFIYEGGELTISGSVQSDEDLKQIGEIVKDYMGSDVEYHIEVDVNESDGLDYISGNSNWDNSEYDDDDVEEVNNSADETLIDGEDY